MKNLHYNLIFRAEPEGGFTVLVPALSGCITYGKTLADAKIMARDAIEGYIESLKRHHEPIPSDDTTFISSVQISEPSRITAHKKTLVYA